MGKKYPMIKNVFLFVILCLIGGTTYAFQKLGLKEGLPFWSAGLRFLIAGTLMLIYILATKKFVIDKNTLATAMLYGIFYFSLPFGAVYWVCQYLPSGLLSVLSSSVTVFAVGFNFLFKGEQTSKSQIIGISLSMIGIIIIFIQSTFIQFNFTMVICLTIALFAYLGAAFSTAFLKSKVHKINQVSFNAIALCIGGITLLLISIVSENGNRSFSGISLFTLIYLAIVGSMCATRITTYLMSQWHIAKVMAYRFISPIISLIVGFLFFSEKLSFNELVGIVFIITGAVFINKSDEKQHCIH